MARTLSFQVGDAVYSATPVKIERKKLYGWTETLALNDDGEECSLASIDETGAVIIPRGGIALGRLSPERRWVERAELKAVTPDGADAVWRQSSYSGTIPLTCAVTADELLEHHITGFYQIAGADPALAASLAGQIYKFEYLYSDGYSGKQAFLLESGGFLYMLVGEADDFPFIGLEESVLIEAEDEAEDEEAGDDIDFSMF
ncbi:MAG: hypothetical protein LBS10_08655 [Gracilibacteraceae bacterium]|jgi:hypothetical protein|nr:hypothetical protein [Gracilibacteraceae bacterium]